MAGTVLDVEPQDFLTSSAAAASAARAVSSAGGRLRSALAGSSSMAGSDSTGRKWAEQYDRVAADAVAGVDALETAFGQIAAGLSVTGLNYATADWLSSGKSGHAPGYSVPSLPVVVCSAAPPSSSGDTGSCDIPGWHYVADFIGDMWPDGDTGKLRAAKSAWESFADQLDAVRGGDVTRVLSALDGTQTPELPAIHRTVSTVRSNVARLSQEARNLASAAGQLADQIDKVHQQTEQELASLGTQLVATAAVGIGLTIFTAGLSDAAGALAAGGEIAAAVARILSFIAELVTTVSRLVETIAESAGAVARVAGASEQITIRIVTIAGNSVVTGVGGAVTNVGVTEIVDPGADLKDAALQGFVVGAGFGVLGEGAKAAFAAKDARGAATAAAGSKTATTEIRDLSTMSAEDWVKQFDLAPPKDQAVFWSGKVDGVGVMDDGAAYAASNRGKTLEQLLGERGITDKMPAYDIEDTKSVAAWEEVSRSFAKGASGDVRAFTGNLREGSIWETIEMPMLKQNPAVKSITIVDAATGKSTSVWTRAGVHAG